MQQAGHGAAVAAVPQEEGQRQVSPPVPATAVTPSSGFSSGEMTGSTSYVESSHGAVTEGSWECPICEMSPEDGTAVMLHLRSPQGYDAGTLLHPILILSLHIIFLLFVFFFFFFFCSSLLP